MTNGQIYQVGEEGEGAWWFTYFVDGEAISVKLTTTNCFEDLAIEAIGIAPRIDSITFLEPTARWKHERGLVWLI